MLPFCKLISVEVHMTGFTIHHVVTVHAGISNCINLSGFSVLNPFPVYIRVKVPACILFSVVTGTTGISPACSFSIVDRGYNVTD